MNIATKKTIAVAGSSLMVLTMGAAGIAPALASTGSELAYATGEETQVLETGTFSQVICDRVEGTFSFVQGETDANVIIKNVMAPQFLCGATALGTAETAVSLDQWSITVGGDVQSSFTTTLGELVKKNPAQLTMSCSCAGNPAGGRASVTATVFGVDLKSIMADAQPDAGVNTVVFTCADGYRIAMPLLYVIQHYSVLAVGINGEPVNNSMGGTNQLWIGSTAANYYTRDVVAISFETWDTPPARPGSDASAVANVPNVSIMTAEG